MPSTRHIDYEGWSYESFEWLGIDDLPIDRFSRNQPGIAFYDLWPTPDDGTCTCGCRTKLKGRQTRWAHPSHADKCSFVWSIIQGQSGALRQLVRQRDDGVCRACGVVCERRDEWHADHIVPVERGGGACGLSNLQTLCVECHKAKTAREASERATVITPAGGGANNTRSGDG